jgi:hypothetical protein
MDEEVVIVRREETADCVGPTFLDPDACLPIGPPILLLATAIATEMEGSRVLP